MNGRSKYPSPLISELVTNTPGNSLQQFNTHDHFEKFDIFVVTITHACKRRIFSTLMNWLFIG